MQRLLVITSRCVGDDWWLAPKKIQTRIHPFHTLRLSTVRALFESALGMMWLIGPSWFQRDRAWCIFFYHKGSCQRRFYRWGLGGIGNFARVALAIREAVECERRNKPKYQCGQRPPPDLPVMMFAGELFDGDKNKHGHSDRSNRTTSYHDPGKPTTNKRERRRVASFLAAPCPPPTPLHFAPSHGRRIETIQNYC